MAAIKKTSGFTLIELMIAMTLGLILLNGVIAIYLHQLKTSLLVDAQSRMQNSAYYAFTVIGNDLRDTGFSGCRILENTNFLNTLTPSDPDFETYMYIEGLSSNQAQAWNGNVDGSSDAIRIQRLQLQSLSFSSDINNSSRSITVNDASDISANDILYITDCENGSLFQAASVSGNTITINNDIIPSNTTFLANDSQLFRVVTTTYSIRPSATLNNASQYTNSLFMGDEEIVEGVDAVYFLFGLDTNNDNWADQYVTTTNLDKNNLHSHDDIVSVRLVIKAHSVNTVDSNGVLNRVYVRTFHVRNKELERNL